MKVELNIRLLNAVLWIWLAVGILGLITAGFPFLNFVFFGGSK